MVSGETSGKKWTVEVVEQLNLDFDSNAVYPWFFVPVLPAALDVVQLCQQIAHMFAGNPWLQAPPAIVDNAISIRRNEADRHLSTKRLVDTRQVVIYVDGLLSDSQSEKVYAYGDSVGVHVRIRDQKYLNKVLAEEKPLAFICHDSRDRDLVAKPLAQSLTRLLGRVWYDEYSLRVGDSLRERIEKGLKDCHRCILVLTPNFLTNTGWTKVEFNSIFTREILERRSIVLPVWHLVSSREVFEYSPSLADRVGLRWDMGADEVANLLRDAILKP